MNSDKIMMDLVSSSAVPSGPLEEPGAALLTDHGSFCMLSTGLYDPNTFRKRVTGEKFKEVIVIPYHITRGQTPTSASSYDSTVDYIHSQLHQIHGDEVKNLSTLNFFRWQDDPLSQNFKVTVELERTKRKFKEFDTPPVEALLERVSKLPIELSGCSLYVTEALTPAEARQIVRAGIPRIIHKAPQTELVMEFLAHHGVSVSEYNEDSATSD